MLSGVKYIPRDQIETAQEKEDLVASTKEKHKLGGRKDKNRRKKKRQSSDEYSMFSENEFENSSDLDDKKYWNKRKGRKIHGDSSEGEASHKSKRIPKRRRKHYSSKDSSSSSDEHEDSDDLSSRKSKHQRGSRKHDHNRNKDIGGGRVEGNFSVVDDGRKYSHEDKQERKEMGLEWMVKPVPKPERNSTPTNESQPEEPQVEELKRLNPRELNPYLEDNGSGYPEDADQTKVGSSQLVSSSVIGDGGASWRLKALKRAQEQAARDGRKLDEVVGERWGSLGQLAVSVSSRAAAPSRAHLHAIKDRKRWVGEKHGITADSFAKSDAKDLPSNSRENTSSISHKHPEMREPKVHDSLQWRRRKDEKMSTKDAGIISAAISNLNKFSNDGSFMAKVIDPKNNDQIGFFGSSRTASEKNEHIESELVSSCGNRISEDGPAAKPSLNANQLAAKALQLRMKGKHEEAEKLLKEAQSMDVRQDKKDDFPRRGTKESCSRYVIPEISVRQKEEEDADMHLAQKILKNKQYSTSGHVDDEYEFGDSPSRKKNRRKGVLNEDSKLSKTNKIAKRMLTQQDRCQFCFENPTRPRHLVISIANFTYLMLPQWQPVVPGHCCILPMQHESSMRTVDNNVWEEIRNFKKCLIVMFEKQEKGVVFLETVMGLAQQRRHCLVECIPLPQDVARQAPLYFKKGIDEAEDEWSQHNAKKLIDTTEKGLRGSIPKDFPYFYVEFGLDRGFVHVIDDETQFKSNFGLNVIRGMLQLPEEDMYRRRKHESAETQKHAVAAFAREWEPFDWTKQLD